jgi:hypothetical protein
MTYHCLHLSIVDVKLLAESLPRRNSSLLLVRLGGLFLRDLVTEGTMFPLLVFPNPVCIAAWLTHLCVTELHLF